MVTEANLSEWIELSSADPSSTVFQLPWWIYLAATQEKSKVRILKFSAGPNSVLLPLLETSRFLLPRLISPFGTYSAPLSHEGLTFDHLKRISADLRKYTINYSGSPFSENQLQLGQPTSNRSFVINLNKITSNKVEANWNKSRRECLRRGLRAGLRVRRGVTDSDWNAYWAIYQLQLLKWGSSVRREYDFEFFTRLRQTWNFHCCHFYVVEAPDSRSGSFGQYRIIAGLLAFSHHGRLHAWQCAADKNWLPFGVHAVMHWGILKDALIRGYHLYDLNPSGGLGPIEAFKRSLGATPLPFFGFHHRNTLTTRLYNLKTSLPFSFSVFPFGIPCFHPSVT